MRNSGVSFTTFVGIVIIAIGLFLLWFGSTFSVFIMGVGVVVILFDVALTIFNWVKDTDIPKLKRVEEFLIWVFFDEKRKKFLDTIDLYPFWILIASLVGGFVSNIMFCYGADGRFIFYCSVFGAMICVFCVAWHDMFQKYQYYNKYGKKQDD